MLISTTILYCDGYDGTRKCENRLLINRVLQPLLEGIDQGWKMDNPTHSGGDTKHFCPDCVQRHKRKAVAEFRRNSRTVSAPSKGTSKR